MRISFYSNRIQFTGDYLEKVGLGGSESALINISNKWKQLYPNDEVIVYNGNYKRSITIFNGVIYKTNLDFLLEHKTFNCDVFISLRDSFPFISNLIPFIDSKIKCLWSQDDMNETGLIDISNNKYSINKIDLIFVVSNHSFNSISQVYDKNKLRLLRNGYNSNWIEGDNDNNENIKDNNKFIKSNIKNNNVINSISNRNNNINVNLGNKSIRRYSIRNGQLDLKNEYNNIDNNNDNNDGNNKYEGLNEKYNKYVKIVDREGQIRVVRSCNCDDDNINSVGNNGNYLGDKSECKCEVGEESGDSLLECKKSVDENISNDFKGIGSRSKIAVYSSTPFRGLEWLSMMWDEIYSGSGKYSELKVYSGMSLYQQPDTNFLTLYEKLNKQTGIHMIGAIPQRQLYKELHKTKVLLYPNTFLETSCMSVLEALACGNWVVTSDMGALPEQVKHGVNGFLIPADYNNPIIRKKFIEYSIDALNNNYIPNNKGLIFSWKEQVIKLKNYIREYLCDN